MFLYLALAAKKKKMTYYQGVVFFQIVNSSKTIKPEHPVEICALLRLPRAPPHLCPCTCFTL